MCAFFIHSYPPHKQKGVRPHDFLMILPHIYALSFFHFFVFGCLIPRDPTTIIIPPASLERIVADSVRITEQYLP
mgnify:CR=1 FL=1